MRRPGLTIRRWRLLLAAAAGLAPCAAAAPVDKSAAVVVRELRFAGDGAELVADLLLPAGAGPFPGAVIVHGSGASDRGNQWSAAWAEALAARGVAVLHPDKRGSGASGGRWQGADLGQLAADARAGLARLAAESAVDPARCGLIGFSQGGQIAPLAADTTAAFAVCVSGSLVPMLEQLGDELLADGRREGLDDSGLAALLAVHDRAGAWLLGAGGWEAYAAARAEALAGPLAGSGTGAAFPDSPGAPAWEILRAFASYDPLPAWRTLRAPALFVYGGRDGRVEVAKSVDILQRELLAGDRRATLLLSGANGHALFREDALDFVSRWIRDGGAD